MYSTWDPRVFDLFIIILLLANMRRLSLFPASLLPSPGSITLDDLVMDGITTYAAATQRMPVGVWGSIHELAFVLS
ncbi:hypothetical protein B0H13DRAFT_2340054 [Mycena leptocephala]|nr:hypothetical protein B0H13DRAFT_2340054 [Mycena leptocephala]